MFEEIQVNFYLLGKRFVMTHPPLFTPVNSTAVTSQADENTPLIPVFDAEMTGKPEKPINPFRMAAKGMASDTIPYTEHCFICAQNLHILFP